MKNWLTAIKRQLLRKSLCHPDCKSEKERLVCTKDFPIQVIDVWHSNLLFNFFFVGKLQNEVINHKQMKEMTVANEATQLQAEIWDSSVI